LFTSVHQRFGFSADLAQRLQIPFELEVPGAFMALELVRGALRGISGRVKPLACLRIGRRNEADVLDAG